MSFDTVRSQADISTQFAPASYKFNHPGCLQLEIFDPSSTNSLSKAPLSGHIGQLTGGLDLISGKSRYSDWMARCLNSSELHIQFTFATSYLFTNITIYSLGEHCGQSNATVFHTVNITFLDAENGVVESHVNHTVGNNGSMVCMFSIRTHDVEAQFVDMKLGKGNSEWVALSQVEFQGKRGLIATMCSFLVFATHIGLHSYLYLFVCLPDRSPICLSICLPAYLRLSVLYASDVCLHILGKSPGSNSMVIAVVVLLSLVICIPSCISIARCCKRHNHEKHDNSTTTSRDMELMEQASQQTTHNAYVSMSAVPRNNSQSSDVFPKKHRPLQETKPNTVKPYAISVLPYAVVDIIADQDEQ